MAKNPFRPAEQVQKRLKVLVYGESGAGKTWFALTFPGPIAVIDCEGGTELYGGRDDVQQFDVLRTKSYEDVVRALDFIEQDGGQTYNTVVVDPITVIWQILQEAAALKNEQKARNGKLRDASLTFRDWGVIKRRVHRLYVKLTNLPCHVVVTARLKDEFSQSGNELVKVGQKPDSEKNTQYLFDIVLRLVRTVSGDNAQYRAVIEKDRSSTLPAAMDDASYTSLAHIAERYQNGEQVHTEADDEVAGRTAAEMEQEERTETNGKTWQRPMAPPTLRSFLNKRVHETVAANPGWNELCDPKNGQEMAIAWDQAFSHKRELRLVIASYMLAEDISTFNELSEAEIHVLLRWMSSDPKSALAEVDQVIELLQETSEE